MTVIEEPYREVSLSELMVAVEEFEAALWLVDDDQAGYLRELVAKRMHYGRRADSIGWLLGAVRGAIADATKGADYFMAPDAIAQSAADEPLSRLSWLNLQFERALQEQADNRLFDRLNGELRSWQAANGIVPGEVIVSGAADQYQVIQPGSPESRARSALLGLLESSVSVAERWGVLDAELDTARPNSLAWAWLRVLLAHDSTELLPAVADLVGHARAAGHAETNEMDAPLAELTSASKVTPGLVPHLNSQFWRWQANRKVTYAMRTRFAERRAQR